MTYEAIFLPPLPPSAPPDTGQSCNNGVAGVMSADASVCCASDCEVCGEEACSTFSYLGAGANDCCSTDIFVFGELCESTGEAPCVITAGVPGASNHSIFPRPAHAPPTILLETGPEGWCNKKTWIAPTLLSACR